MKGDKVQPNHEQLLEPQGPLPKRARQPRKPRERSTVYRKPNKLDLSQHEASILSEEDIRTDARAYLRTIKH